MSFQGMQRLHRTRLAQRILVEAFLLKNVLSTNHGTAPKEMLEIWRYYTFHADRARKQSDVPVFSHNIRLCRLVICNLKVRSLFQMME